MESIKIGDEFTFTLYDTATRKELLTGKGKALEYKTKYDTRNGKKLSRPLALKNIYLKHQYLTEGFVDGFALAKLFCNRPFDWNKLLKLERILKKTKSRRIQEKLQWRIFEMKFGKRKKFK